MRKINTSVFLGLTGVLVALFCNVVLKKDIVRADSPSVIINEIMYHPQSNIDGDEFLELYNTTASTVDLTGWCFTDGIVLCFDPGTTIASHAYGVVSPDAARTLSTYGVSTIGTYTGKLDNGGEKISLSDNSSQVVNELTYDDVAPWPVTPDGAGPSLELKDTTLDNTTAASWSASIGAPTPGAQNSVVGLVFPELANISVPTDVTPSDTPLITVEASDTTSVTLAYKVMFDAEQTITMHDDGTNGDVTSDDGTYSARIPAQTANKLVRYRVSAINNVGTSLLPSDTINYQGYVVKDPGLSSQLPILQFFIEPSVLDDMITNHSQDDNQFPCVIAYGNTVIDNSKVHIKGSTTRNLPKKAFAIDLPKGHRLQFGGMTRAVDEFHLNSTYLDPSGISDIMAWRLAKEIGMPVTQMFKIRLQTNGSFYGLYTFAEEYDKTWRETFNYESGSFYKDRVKKTRLDIDDGTELQDWGEATSLPANKEERLNYAVDNQNIPNVLNFAAFEMFIRNADWTFGKNWLSYHDIGGTGRWNVLPYDLDGAGGHGSASVPGQDFVSPYEFPGGSGRFTREWRGPVLALYDSPEYRAAYYRRLRTLVDDYLLTGWYRDQYEDLKTKTAPEFALDYQKWGSISDPEYTLESIDKVIKEMEFNFTKKYRNAWGVPDAQNPFATVSIESINTNISNHQEDYIVLKNNTASAIDITGWAIPELNYTFQIGAVIAPGQSAYLPRNDQAFTAANSGAYVIGQINEDIQTLTTLNLYRLNGTVSDSEGVL